MQSASVSVRRARQQLTDVLAVTLRHRNDLCADRHELAARELRSAAASGADAERNLIRRAPVIPRTTEHMARHRE
jgi:hypothetical protein